eukprot:TRINITY_DN35784_c0_g1_i1.p1 TRINITY_DN35784_c0_g1~~TRINITY_DN35784_c0_g1_i1.p1  ORF type:complete len:222 (+),score=43.53 TRINITY_DN35784_c0_g1_i1:44-667(+)
MPSPATSPRQLPAVGSANRGVVARHPLAPPRPRRRRRPRPAPAQQPPPIPARPDLNWDDWQGRVDQVVQQRTDAHKKLGAHIRSCTDRPKAGYPGLSEAGSRYYTDVWQARSIPAVPANFIPPQAPPGQPASGQPRPVWSDGLPSLDRGADVEWTARPPRPLDRGAPAPAPPRKQKAKSRSKDSLQLDCDRLLRRIRPRQPRADASV